MYEKIAMRRREVESSNIKSIGHSYPRRLLEIEFKDGNIYRYKGVNHRTYKALMNAESKGKEFHKNIKYSYPYKKYKDKEGNKMNEKYEMLVKQAYEDIVDSFEKEAMVLKSPVGSTMKQALSLGRDNARLAEHANKISNKMYSTSPHTKEYEQLSKTRSNAVSAHRQTTGKIYDLKNSPQYKQEHQHLHRFDNSVAIPRGNMSLGGKLQAMKTAYEEIMDSFYKEAGYYPHPETRMTSELKTPQYNAVSSYKHGGNAYKRQDLYSKLDAGIEKMKMKAKSAPHLAAQKDYLRKAESIGNMKEHLRLGDRGYNPSYTPASPLGPGLVRSQNY